MILYYFPSKTNVHVKGFEILSFIHSQGGGFFVEYDSTWTIRGIVSATILKGASCDVGRVTVYTNVSWFSDWIVNVISNKGVAMYSMFSIFYMNQFCFIFGSPVMK